jgi:hypothetical protein
MSQRLTQFGPHRDSSTRLLGKRDRRQNEDDVELLAVIILGTVTWINVV